MTTTHDNDIYTHITDDRAPSPSTFWRRLDGTNDAAQMRDVFASKLDDAQHDHDETGIRIYGDCVNYWARKAEAVTL